MLLYAQLKGSNLNESEGDNPKGKIENRISRQGAGRKLAKENGNALNRSRIGKEAH